MPLTGGFVSRKMCVGPPKQSFVEKPKKKLKIPIYPYDPKLRGGGERIPSKSYATTLKWNESEHPRVPAGSSSGGEFASGKAQGSFAFGSSLTPAQQAMQETLRLQESKPIHRVKTAEEAVPLVLKGENVEIEDTKEVHTLLKELGELAISSASKGEKAPNFDPCTITVKGVSLFCTEKLKTAEFPHGIPRIEMPQFKSKIPVPGSEADKLPRDAHGEVDASQAFLEHLRMMDVEARPATVLARKLKASQAEMEGSKVAGMMLNPSLDPKGQNIWVSKDNYVIDGHHTWAAAIGRDAQDGNLDNDKEMNVVKVDLPMSEVYHIARAWTEKFGLPRVGVKKQDYKRVLMFN